MDSECINKISQLNKNNLIKIMTFCPLKLFILLNNFFYLLISLFGKLLSSNYLKIFEVHIYVIQKLINY